MLSSAFLGWFAYFIAFLALFFGGPAEVGIGLLFLSIGMIFHWRFWAGVFIGALIGYLTTRG